MEMEEDGSNHLRRRLIQKRHGVLPGRFGLKFRWQIRCGADAEDMQRNAEPTALAGKVRISRHHLVGEEAGG